MIRRCNARYGVLRSAPMKATATMSLGARGQAHRASTVAARPCSSTDFYSGMDHRELRAALVARDEIIRQLSARIREMEATAKAEDAAAIAPPADVATTEEEVIKALGHGRTSIVLPRGAKIYLSQPLIIQNEVSIVGEGMSAADRPVLYGSVTVSSRNAKLVARQIHFAANSRAEPALSLTTGASAQLVDSTISGARDGVNLSGQSCVTLEQCMVTQCIRGVFESHRCTAKLFNCVFVDNTFHAVLLNSPTAEAVVAHYAAGNTFAGGRADLSLSYNPMLDRYSDTYKAGARITLSDLESTTDLADPIW